MCFIFMVENEFQLQDQHQTEYFFPESLMNQTKYLCLKLNHKKNVATASNILEVISLKRINLE